MWSIKDGIAKTHPKSFLFPLRFCFVPLLVPDPRALPGRRDFPEEMEEMGEIVLHVTAAEQLQPLPYPL